MLRCGPRRGAPAGLQQERHPDGCLKRREGWQVSSRVAILLPFSGKPDSMPLLSWFNRDADLTRAAVAPYRLLEPVTSLSYGDPDSPNMLIEGDNLDALKSASASERTKSTEA